LSCHALHAQAPASPPASFNIMDATIDGIHAAMKSGMIDPVEVSGLFDLMQASGSTPSTYETAAAIDAYLAEHPKAPVKTYAEMGESSLVVEPPAKGLRDDIGQSPDDPIFLKQLRVRETLRTAVMKVMAE